MVYLDRAPAMDPSPSSSLNKLSDDITDAKIIEVIIEYCGLKKLKGRVNVRKLKRHCSSFFTFIGFEEVGLEVGAEINK